MATRRLVQRSRQNEESSPAPRARQQQSTPSGQRVGQPTSLPPYEPPACPINTGARRELERLSISYDYQKYTLTLKGCRQNLITTTADVFERAKLRRDDATKHTARRRKAGANEDEKTEQEVEALNNADALEAKAQELRELTEKALRDVIDLEDELNMHETLMKDAIASIPPPPEPRRVEAPLARDQDDDDDGEDPPEAQPEVIYEVPDVAGVSAIDVLSKQREGYLEKYQAKTLRQRYENTDYANFVRTIHTSQHGDDMPVPHARTWFAEEMASTNPGLGQPQAGGSEDDSDEDVVVSRASATLKCLFTLQYFKEPFSNNVCKHTFEKAAFLEYFRKEAKHHQQRRDNRGRAVGPAGPRKVECPQSGCDKLLEPNDFFVDQLIARQVRRAKQEEARGEVEDDEDMDDDSTIPGTQRSRPAEVDSGDDVEFDEDEGDRNRQILKIKRERAQSRGASVMSSRQAATEPMELDDDSD